jgi:RNA polymerase sigma factor (sigma-70 family)
MRMQEPTPQALDQARAGDMAALDALLAGIQPAVFNFAARMLGNREDAADSTQEILLKVVTHLGAFRGEAAFTTWVWSIAQNHLLRARTRSAESPEMSLEALEAKLGAGMAIAERLQGDGAAGSARVLTPEDKLEARQVAISCTQQMLMAMDRDHRAVYVLDTVFDLPSAAAAQVLGLTPEAYRQRLSRARARLEGFMHGQCGLVGAQAACRCEAQVSTLRHLSSTAPKAPAPRTLKLQPVELVEAQRTFEAFTRVGDAAAVMRQVPELAAPESMRDAIRAVLTQEGFMREGPLQ